MSERQRSALLPRAAFAAAVALLLGATTARADGAVFGEGRRFDLRLSPGIGAFYYPQIVEGGGYYVDGTGYNLIWYGAQPQLTGELQFFLPTYPRVSAGLGGAFFLGLGPKGMEEGGAFTRSAGSNAVGGFGGASGSYWLGRRTRLNLLIGYGGTGVSDKYGGFGVAVSMGATWLRPFGDVLGGVGFRFTYMALSSPGDADTSGESGGYMAMLLEGTFDWAPRSGEAVTPLPPPAAAAPAPDGAAPPADGPNPT